MIEFGGIIYYLDINAFDKAISPTGYKPNDKIITKETKTYHDEHGEVSGSESYETSTTRGKEIDLSKFEVLKTMIEVLIDYDDNDADTTLGAERALENTSLAYKIAFNTLYNYGILKEKE
jgi:hypothetical protein